MGTAPGCAEAPAWPVLSEDSGPVSDSSSGHLIRGMECNREAIKRRCAFRASRSAGKGGLTPSPGRCTWQAGKQVRGTTVGAASLARPRALGQRGGPPLRPLSFHLPKAYSHLLTSPEEQPFVLYGSPFLSTSSRVLNKETGPGLTLLPGSTPSLRCVGRHNAQLGSASCPNSPSQRLQGPPWLAGQTSSPS